MHQCRQALEFVDRLSVCIVCKHKRKLGRSNFVEKLSKCGKKYDCYMLIAVLMIIFSGHVAG